MARPKLTRAEQRFNYAIAIAAVAIVAASIVFSPQVSVAGTTVPVLALALIVAAFLFGLGQMLIGISRRRRYLAGLAPEEDPDPRP
jgi:ABC-type polysaccharide/polyol phosphate export permease